jgi:hypothetical protein
VTLEKKEWVERVIKTQNFHIDNIKSHEKRWTVRDTARELKRSLGSISQDLMLALWFRTHREVLEKMEYKDAIEYVRSRKHKMLTDKL